MPGWKAHWTYEDFAEVEFEAVPETLDPKARQTFEQRLCDLCSTARFAFGAATHSKAQLVTRYPQLGDELALKLIDDYRDGAKLARELADVIEAAERRLLSVMATVTLSRDQRGPEPLH
jgi:hypothetical protein